ncbi:hypothetical protein [Subtercola sp. RTI3]|uniref:hypothetical protein n=1 Tax=Subtercola sp. RTI3 TaxID=3048639 RepID=UPI002B230113|nr:hypothetical protein [Subtercola sp. RTI3]MEA9984428.1 hypothetical protein [Subtercola sp. RTI3]
MPPPASRATLARTAIVALAAVVAGIGSYVLLIFVSHGTSTSEYANFAVFWSLTVTIGLGFFYPVEQESARSIAGTQPGARPGGRGGMARFVLLCGAALALVTSLAALLLFTPGGAAYIGSPALVVALILSFVGYAVQFPVRGMMSGSHRTTTYSAIIAVEGMLRILLPALILFAGFSGAFSFALVVPVAAAVSILPALLGRDRSWWGFSALSPRLFAGHLARLIVAALSIQLILNSGTLVAKVVGGTGSEALTGQILVCLSIARIPVFVYQVLQILYLPRLAGQWKARDLHGARRTLLAAIGAAAAVGLVIVAGMSVLGPFVIGLLFGADRVLSVGGIVLVSVGVGVFLTALVASDGSLALGRHSVVIRSWAIAAVAAAATVVVVGDPLLRVTCPLIIGSSIALIQLVAGLARTIRARSTTAREASTS